MGDNSVLDTSNFSPSFNDVLDAIKSGCEKDDKPLNHEDYSNFLSDCYEYNVNLEASGIKITNPFPPLIDVQAGTLYLGKPGRGDFNRLKINIPGFRGSTRFATSGLFKIKAKGKQKFSCTEYTAGKKLKLPFRLFKFNASTKHKEATKMENAPAPYSLPVPLVQTGARDPAAPLSPVMDGASSLLDGEYPFGTTDELLSLPYLES